MALFEWSELEWLWMLLLLISLPTVGKVSGKEAKTCEVVASEGRVKLVVPLPLGLTTLGSRLRLDSSMGTGTTLLLISSLMLTLLVAGDMVWNGSNLAVLRKRLRTRSAKLSISEEVSVSVSMCRLEASSGASKLRTGISFDCSLSSLKVILFGFLVRSKSIGVMLRHCR